MNTSMTETKTHEWFDQTRQDILDALGADHPASAKVDQLVDEIRVLRQSTSDLLALAWKRGTAATRDYQGNVVEPCPYGDDAEPVVYTAEQLRAAREAAWDAGREQGTEYGWTFDSFREFTDEDRAEAYGVNPWKVQTLLDQYTGHIEAILRPLEDGWYGRGSEAPSEESIDRLEAVLSLATLGPEGLSICAGANGAIVLEWQARSIEHTISLYNDGTFFVCADHVLTDETTETEGDFDALYLAAQLQAAGETHAAALAELDALPT